MNLPSIQVADLNTAYLQTLKKYERDKGGYFELYLYPKTKLDSRKKDRHKLNRKTRY